MNKSKHRKRIGIIVGAVLLVVVVAALVNFWPILSMRPAATGKIENTEIVSIKVGINSLYLISSSDGYIVIDAGTNAANAEKAIKEMGIDPQDVKHVLLTHSDSDHVATLTVFRNAQVYMSEDELQMLDGTTKRSGSQFNSLPGSVALTSFFLLEADQELSIGGHQIVCVKMPGHTPGSMAYILDDMHLFTGDALRVRGGSIVTHPFTMDEETAKASIQKLKESLDSYELLLTAHYGYYACDALK